MEGFFGGTEESKGTIKEAVENAVKQDKGNIFGIGSDDSIDMNKFNDLPDPVKEAYFEESDNRQEDGVDIPDSNISQPSDSNQEDFSDYSDNNNDSDNSSGYGADSDTDSGDYEATGGLLTKRKASGKVKDKWKKKMKRGGLASR